MVSNFIVRDSSGLAHSQDLFSVCLADEFPHDFLGYVGTNILSIVMIKFVLIFLNNFSLGVEDV